MTIFSPHVEQLVELALAEDLCGGDVTSNALFEGHERARAYLVAKADLVLAGGPVFAYVMQRVARLPGPSGEVALHFERADGSEVVKGTRLATLSGPVTRLLQGERVALNLLQHLSAVATATHRFVAILGPRTAIVDTRKTLPGLRELDRYAVRMGGGRNHRFNLGSGVLIKDNHIAAAGGVRPAVERARARAPFPLRIEVEVETLAQLDEALAARADIIMLDNMTLATLREAVERTAGRALLEVSGNVTLDRAAELATLGVDFVSCGALTHSVAAADISMRFELEA